ncbi:MAG: hypothetical protein HY360_18305 [Verrucomicrobia bacterium]|nr:hypothetical protein [Verrucomicrobiota bacterium]
MKKHLLTFSIGIVLGMPTVQGAETGKATVLLKDTFDEDTSRDIGWDKPNSWERVDDKSHGANDRASVTPAKKLSYLRLKLPEPINLDTEKCFVRFSARIRSIPPDQKGQTRLELNLGKEDGSYYTMQITPEAVRVFMLTHPGSPEQKQMGQRSASTHKMAEDEQYHTYTLELRSKGIVAVYFDGEKLDEQELRDPDNPETELTRLWVGFVDSSEEGSGGKNWFLDELTLAKEPAK